MPGAAREPLSPLESRVMDLVWSRGSATAETITEALGGRLSNASVRTLLRRIEAKRFLTHRVEGRTFVYEPRIDAPTAARSAIRRVLDRFYGGSVEALVAGLVDGRMIDRRQLRRLADQVRTAERTRKRGGDA